MKQFIAQLLHLLSILAWIDLESSHARQVNSRLRPLATPECQGCQILSGPFNAAEYVDGSLITSSPYLNIFRRFKRNPQGLQYYNSYRRDYRIPAQNKANVHFQTGNQQDNADEVHQNYPDSLVKDGKVFFRHVANPTVGSYVSDPTTASKDNPNQSKWNHGSDPQRSGSSMSDGFNFLMEQVSSISSQQPIVSAAIAGASVRSSKKGGSSHVIGSALNGGYFSASAGGSDGNGRAMNTHIHGTADQVNGEAFARSPDQESKTLVQIDHSEQGLYVGESSAKNGETHIRAGVNRNSKHFVQSGDSTSSYDDPYKTKMFGHTFGEAQSKLIPLYEDEKNIKIDLSNSNNLTYQENNPYYSQTPVENNTIDIPIEEDFKNKSSSSNFSYIGHRIDNGGLTSNPREGNIKQFLTGSFSERDGNIPDGYVTSSPTHLKNQARTLENTEGIIDRNFQTYDNDLNKLDEKNTDYSYNGDQTTNNSHINEISDSSYPFQHENNDQESQIFKSEHIDNINKQNISYLNLLINESDVRRFDYPLQDYFEFTDEDFRHSTSDNLNNSEVPQTVEENIQNSVFSGNAIGSSEHSGSRNVLSSHETSIKYDENMALPGDRTLGSAFTGNTIESSIYSGSRNFPSSHETSVKMGGNKSWPGDKTVGSTFTGNINEGSLHSSSRNIPSTQGTFIKQYENRSVGSTEYGSTQSNRKLDRTPSIQTNNIDNINAHSPPIYNNGNTDNFSSNQNTPGRNNNEHKVRNTSSNKDNNFQLTWNPYENTQNQSVNQHFYQNVNKAVNTRYNKNVRPVNTSNVKLPSSTNTLFNNLNKNVVSMPLGGNSGSIYPPNGAVFNPGEQVPGIPGYIVPQGFRGKVVYSKSLPSDDMTNVIAYNKHIQLPPGTPYFFNLPGNNFPNFNSYPDARQIGQTRRYHGNVQQPIVTQQQTYNSRQPTYRNYGNQYTPPSFNSQRTITRRVWNNNQRRGNHYTPSRSYPSTNCGYYSNC